MYRVKGLGFRVEEFRFEGETRLLRALGLGLRVYGEGFLRHSGVFRGIGGV